MTYDYLQAIRELTVELRRLEFSEAQQVDDAVSYGSVSTEILMHVRHTLRRLQLEHLPPSTANSIEALLANLNRHLE